QRRHDLQLGERAASRIPFVRDDLIRELLNRVDEAPVRMPGDVPRTRAGAHARMRRLVRRERTGRRVEAIDDDAIRAEGRRERKAIARIDAEPMCIRLRLTLRMHAAAAVLHECGLPTETAVGQSLVDLDVTASVVRIENEAPRAIQGNVARSAAYSRPVIQECERARGTLDREAAHTAGRTGVAHV